MYDGSFYSGYAKQNNTIKTVQQELETMLEKMFNEKITTFSSGRTDKYVHAIDQTAHFKSKQKINVENVKKFLNDNLEHIYIKNVEIVPENFHSRFSIKSKTYAYIINTSSFNIFRTRYEYQYNKEIDINKLKYIINYFVGKKDYRSFSTSDLENSVRKINWVKILKSKTKVIILINGEGFLRNMVRMIVANIIAFCEEKINEDDVKRLFNNPKKGSSIYKAPGCGLYLLKTNY